MKYNHLTINERACIYQFKQMGQSIRKIAKAIDRSPSTISRELKRNSYKTSINYSVTRYSPITAQNKYEIRRTNYHKKCFFNEEIKNYIDSKIQLHWSPDQIVERYGKNKPNLPSISTIYRWINLGYLINGDKTKLSRKGTFKKPAETKGRFNLGKTIRKRPKEIYKRDFFEKQILFCIISRKKNKIIFS